MTAAQENGVWEILTRVWGLRAHEADAWMAKHVAMLNLVGSIAGARYTERWIVEQVGMIVGGLRV